LGKHSAKNNEISQITQAKRVKPSDVDLNLNNERTEEYKTSFVSANASSSEDNDD
jgi:hypothetical protein